MPYTVDFLEDRGIVVIENTGKITYEDFEKQTREAVELGRLKNARLGLSDCTRLTGNLDTLELFDFPKMYERVGLPKSHKLAILMSEELAASEGVEFFETVCRNRGWQIRVFSARESAFQWLLGTT